MRNAKQWTVLAAMLMISVLLLSACGGDATATTAPAAAPTNTTGAMAAPTHTTAALPAATDTPAAAAMTPTTGGAMGGAFDPAKVKKIQVESGATLRISGGGSTQEQEQFRQQLARFSQVYPEVMINYEPNPNDYNTKLKAQFAGGQEPDVFNLEPPVTEDLASSNLVLDLSSYLAEAGRSKADYFPALIAIFSRGDKIYGLPRDFGSLALFYNTDLVAKAGAPMPKAGWTQDDFTAFAKAATQGTDPASKVYGTITQADYARWLPFALANGATLLDSTGKQCTINSPPGVDALNWWYGMWKDKIAAQAKIDLGADWGGEAFAKQRTASVVEGGWLIPFMNDPKAGFDKVKYDVAPLPLGKSGGKGDLLFTNAWGASARTKFPKAAAALILFLAGPENQEVVLQSGFALPTLKGFETNAFFQGSGLNNRVQNILYSTASYGLVDYFGPKTDSIHKSLNDAMERLFAGQQDAKAALDGACEEINTALQQ